MQTSVASSRRRRSVPLQPLQTQQDYRDRQAGQTQPTNNQNDAAHLTRSHAARQQSPTQTNISDNTAGGGKGEDQDYAIVVAVAVGHLPSFRTRSVGCNRPRGSNRRSASPTFPTCLAAMSSSRYNSDRRKALAR